MGNQYSIYANAGAVVLLSAGMSDREKQDVQHSLLFAQLAATKRHPLFFETQEWYSTWQQVLKGSWLQRTVGWDQYNPGPASTVTAMEQLVSYMKESLASVDAAEWAPIVQGIARLPATDSVIECLRGRIEQEEQPDGSETGATRRERYRFMFVVAQPGPRLNAVCMTMTSSQGDGGNPFSRVLTADEVSGAIEQRFFQADLSAVLHDPIRDDLAKRLKPFASLIQEMPGRQI